MDVTFGPGLQNLRLIEQLRTPSWEQNQATGEQDVAVWTSATGANWTPPQSSGLNGTEAWQIDALAPSGSAVVGIGSIVTQQSQPTVTFTLPAR